MRKQKNSRKKLIVLYLYMLLLLLLLLSTASYTWFSLSRTPRVSDMNLYISTQTGLELSSDPANEDWVVQLDFRDLVDVTTPLRPITWSEQRQQFYAVTYGFDGRMMDYGSWEPLTDQFNANKNTLDGYYIKATVYARSGVAVDVTLSPAVEVDEGINGAGTYVIGTPVWNEQEILHYNGGRGAECAIRVGFRITQVDSTGAEIGETSELFIYEPNSNVHIDQTIGYTATPNMDGGIGLVPDHRLIRQSASYWMEAFPVERDVVIKELGKFQEEMPTLFSLESGQIVRIDMYIWLEGQDVDCTNEIEEAQILINIQFASETEAQSGMKPIE